MAIAGIDNCAAWIMAFVGAIAGTRRVCTKRHFCSNQWKEERQNPGLRGFSAE